MIHEPSRHGAKVRSERGGIDAALDVRVVVRAVVLGGCLGLFACSMSCRPTGELMFEVGHSATGGVLGFSCDVGCE